MGERRTACSPRARPPAARPVPFVTLFDPFAPNLSNPLNALTLDSV